MDYTIVREFGRAVSRELHDDIAQGIAAAVTRMELGTHYLDGGDSAAARAKWMEAREIARRTLVMSKNLAVRARAFFAGELLQTLEVPDHLVKPPREELSLILREAVNNALDHSGAGTITIRLSVGEGNLTATVEDDGRGIPAGQVDSVASLGLRSICERAELLGGTAALRSSPAKGTRVEVTLPVPVGRNGPV
jgi:signal transduction histidine kinase